MDFKEICKARYSVRAYKPDTIPAEKMDYIKECTRLAPSAVNKQPWKFILFTGEDDRARMQQCYDKECSARLRLISWSAKITGRPGHGGMTRKTMPTSTWPLP